MIVREATVADWPQVTDLFAAAPVQSGTSFVLDRRPDFGALPRLRGQFRTFVISDGERLAGTVTALWRRAMDGSKQVTVGEVIDLRVAPWARGKRVAFHLLRAAHETFRAERVDWILTLVGKHNEPVKTVAARKTSLPALVPLEDFASVHFMAMRLPRRRSGLTVREAGPSDAALLAELCAAQRAAERFAPPGAIPWPDPTGRHRAWLAFGPDGAPHGVLVAWDGEALRRFRIVRYRLADLPLRAVMGVAAMLGRSAALPAPGEVLRLWATRLVVVRSGGARTLRALLDAALGSAVTADCHVLQVNLHSSDPLLRQLPPYPRSTFWSTLYGGPIDVRPVAPLSPAERFHADIARA
jgi:L-amino acid N-acyltransferase YncA